ncbi:hypothetical protein [Brevibacillus formosus]|uniref:hypothetical protein n=1 Tax=Brevibacillus formosus TaxID=54913 RepID=UPI003F19CBF0
MGDRLTEIRNRLENGYYGGIDVNVDGDIGWLLDYIKALTNETIRYRDALEKVEKTGHNDDCMFLRVQRQGIKRWFGYLT